MTTHNGKRITQRGGMDGEYGKVYAKLNPEEQQTAWEDEQYRKMEKDPSHEPPKTSY